MQPEAVEFVTKNYEKIIKLFEMRDEYINYIQRKGIGIIHENNQPDSKVHNWGQIGTALRFYCRNGWHKDFSSNITILLLNDGNFRLQLYIPDCSDEKKREKVIEKFKSNPNDNLIEKGHILVVMMKPDLETLDEAFKLFENAVGIFNELYETDLSD